jgi:DNA-binding Lrp family transcriptional regulator
MKPKIHLLKRNSFPAHSFFDHLLRGTEYYQDREFERAAEEWGAAGWLNYETPINLMRRGGRIFCGGYIHEVPFLFFLYAIYANKPDGIGGIRTDGISKNLIFNQGRLVHAATNRQDERIGHLIVKKHQLSASTLDRLIDDSKKQGKRIGQFLVEKGLLSEGVLRQFLIQQADRILVDIFQWRKGHFYFLERPINADSIVNYDPLNLARIATYSGISFSEFRKKIPNMKTIFRLSPYAEIKKAQIMGKLTDKVKFVFSLIDGVRSIEQLARFSGLDPATILDILYRFNTDGIIRQSNEIIEYEDKQFNEISNILETLLEIYAFVSHLLFSEIGAKAKDVIRQSQQLLTRTHPGIFAGIPLEKPDEVKKDMILRNIAHYYPEPDTRILFVEAFCALIEQMQTASEKYLGRRLAEHAAVKIKTEIKNIARYAQESALRSHLLEAFDKLVHSPSP